MTSGVVAYRQIVDSSLHHSSPDSPSSRHLIADADPLSSDPAVVCPALATDTRNSPETQRLGPALFTDDPQCRPSCYSCEPLQSRATNNSLEIGSGQYCSPTIHSVGHLVTAVSLFSHELPTTHLRLDSQGKELANSSGSLLLVVSHFHCHLVAKLRVRYVEI
ncbi:hypothetical protein ZIOFF_007016 [Zingiber officinale]|uniref:Uncharacterized protein n=1 Tax=Zingiber officinale TaxID=94328 RepID=A0A8J5I0I1_ZINOF|nr:hypothetical protein ZIOFF_007016 [Zingiber officinale]